jgi:hypothetical protein
MPLELSKIFPRLRVETDEYGPLDLRGVTVGDQSFMGKLVDLKLPSREVAAHLISHQLEMPALDLAVVERWDDSLLLRVCAQWAPFALEKRSKRQVTITSFQDFNESLTTYMRESMARWAESARPFLEGLKLTGLLFDVRSIMGTSIGSRLSDILTPFALESVESTRRTILDKALSNIDSFYSLGNATGYDSFAKLAGKQLGVTLSELTSSGMAGHTLSEIGRALSASTVRDLAANQFTLSRAAQEMLEQQGGLMAQTVQRINDLTGHISWRDVSSLVPSFFSNLPDVSEIMRSAREVEEAGALLDESGYGFSGHLWEVAFLRGFLKVNPRARKSQMTKAFLAETQSVEFEEELKGIFLSAQLLKHRWPVVKSILAAHRRRDFLASVPLLYAQIEGMYADALILKGEVLLYRGKLYPRGADGKREQYEVKDKLTGQPTGRMKNKDAITGLRPLIDRSKLRDTRELEVLVETALLPLNSERNPVMHGRNVVYGKSANSNRLILMLYVLAYGVAALEQANKTGTLT